MRETEIIDNDAWKSLGAGFVIALVVLFVPFLGFIFGYLGILVHELGHAVVAWMFGYPAVPAFDFQYGGGVTVHENRRLTLLFLIYVAFAWGFYHYRANRLALGVLGALAALYSLAAMTSLHEILQIFMGHGTELIFAGIFLYRAVSGEKIKIPAERPLYAFVGFFILMWDVRFAVRLLTSHDHRILYEDAKGGGHWMDFSRIAEQYLHTDLSSVAFFFLVCCLLPPVLVYVTYRHRTSIRAFLGRLLVRDPCV